MAEAKKNLIPIALAFVLEEEFPSHVYFSYLDFINQVINEVDSFANSLPHQINPAVAISGVFFSYLKVCAENQSVQNYSRQKKTQYDIDSNSEVLILPVRVRRCGGLFSVELEKKFGSNFITFGLDPTLEDWQARACFDDGSDPNMTIGISDDRLYR